MEGMYVVRVEFINPIDDRHSWMPPELNDEIGRRRMCSAWPS